MKVFFSELCVLGGDPADSVERLMEAGAQNVELMLDGGGWNDFSLRSDELAAKLKSKDIGYAVHTPVWDANLTSENSHIRRAVFETYKQTVLFANKLGADHVVIHPGFCYETIFHKKTAQARAEEAVNHLAEFCKGYETKLLIENVGTVKTSLFTQNEFAAFCKSFPPQVKCLVDVGHAHFNKWDLEKLVADLGDCLYALHLHDNDGLADQHLPIGEGTVDWNRLKRVIKPISENLNLILEYNIGTPLGKLTEGKDFLLNAF